MSDILDGIGTASEGSLWSRALEPESGAKAKHPRQPDYCINCGTELVGAYCHACGQQGHLHRTIGAFMHDLLHGALHFEGKLWRTLPMLVLKPGRLTRRYIDGERARFVSPMALFLFTVFLMFAVFQMLGLSTPTQLDAEVIGSNIEASRAEAREDLRDARARIETSPAGSEEWVEAERDRRLAEEALRGLDRAEIFDIRKNPDVSITGVEWLERGLVRKWRENPGLMLYKLQANAYKFSWMLIPISIPFVWLLFAWKRRFKAYDHAIFVTYSLSFVTLLFIALSVLGLAGVPTWICILIGIFVPPIHLYKQLRQAYELSRFSTFWRLLVLSAFIWIIVALFLNTLLLLGGF